MKLNYIFLINTLLISSFVSAQSFDLQVQHLGNGLLQIEMRETTGGANTPATTDVIADITFALAWSTSCDTDGNDDGSDDVGISVVPAATAGHGNYFINLNGARYTTGNQSDFVQGFAVSNPNFFFPENWIDNTFLPIATLQVSQNGNGFCDFTILEVNVVQDGTGNMTTTQPDFDMAYAPTGSLISYSPNITQTTASNVPLPVELLRFEATLQNAAVLLEWVSATEINFEGYELQRSLDGKQFKKLAWIETAGNTIEAQQYQWVDRDIQSSMVYYYRLALVDEDGSINLSEVRAVHSKGDFDVNLYPSPATDWVTLDVQASNRVEGEIRVMDILNRTVLRQQVVLSKGQNQVDLDCHTFANGQYLVLIETDRGVYKAPLVIQH